MTALQFQQSESDKKWFVCLILLPQKSTSSIRKTLERKKEISRISLNYKRCTKPPLSQMKYIRSSFDCEESKIRNTKPSRKPIQKRKMYLIVLSKRTLNSKVLISIQKLSKSFNKTQINYRNPSTSSIPRNMN